MRGVARRDERRRGKRTSHDARAVRVRIRVQQYLRFPRPEKAQRILDKPVRGDKTQPLPDGAYVLRNGARHRVYGDNVGHRKVRKRDKH